MGDWSTRALAQIAEYATLIINPIIYAEVSIGYTTIGALQVVLPASLYQREPLPWEVGFLAGKSFVLYRRRKGSWTASGTSQTRCRPLSFSSSTHLGPSLKNASVDSSGLSARSASIGGHRVGELLLCSGQPFDLSPIDRHERFFVRGKVAIQSSGPNNPPVSGLVSAPDRVFLKMTAGTDGSVTTNSGSRSCESCRDQPPGSETLHRPISPAVANWGQRVFRLPVLSGAATAETADPRRMRGMAWCFCYQANRSNIVQ
jgi:hypothetical protein